MPTRTISQEIELQDIVDEILSMLPQKKGAHVLALSGELGAGKTAFTKALAAKLGIVEHVTSPTFVVMKRYPTVGSDTITALVHIDAYRIEDIDEMRVIKLDELFKETGSIVCIEWPEKIQKLIPEDALNIQIEIHSNGTRTLTYGS